MSENSRISILKCTFRRHTIWSVFKLSSVHFGDTPSLFSFLIFCVCQSVYIGNQVRGPFLNKFWIIRKKYYSKYCEEAHFWIKFGLSERNITQNFVSSTFFELPTSLRITIHVREASQYKSWPDNKVLHSSLLSHT